MIEGRLRIKYVEMLFSLQFWRQKFRTGPFVGTVFVRVCLGGDPGL